MYSVVDGINVCQDVCVTYLGIDSTLTQEFSSKHYRCVESCADLPLSTIVAQSPQIVNRTVPTSSAVSCVDSCRQTNDTYKLRVEQVDNSSSAGILECVNIDNCAAY